MPRAEPDPQKSLFQRHPGNPILTAKYWPYPVNTVFNAGAVRLHTSGHTLLLVRCEDHRGHSHLTAARSTDGAGGWEIDPSPTFCGEPQNHSEELWGVEDPRITWAPELGRYAVTYVAYGRGGPGVSLALTADFHDFERIGMVLPPEDKDAALFPRRFGGRWAIIHRPVPVHGSADMWISYSPDLVHWGDHRVLIQARRGGWWDARKIGLSPQPIETEDGWLLLYHGVRETAAGALYRLGLALLDLGRVEEARSELVRVLEMIPDHTLAVDALTRATPEGLGESEELAEIPGPLGDLAEDELESAFQDAEAQPDEMLSANRVVAAAVRGIEQDQPEGVMPFPADSPFANETVANLLERQNHLGEARS